MRLAAARQHLSAKRRPFKLTRPGWVLILYTIGIGAGAINTGNNLLYLMFGLFLGVILASGVLSDITLWGVGVRWSAPERGVVGEPLLIAVEIVNRKRWVHSPSFTVELAGTLRAEPVALEVFVPVLDPGERVVRQVVFVPARRGRLQWTALKLRTTFPFGLLTKWWLPDVDVHAAAVETLIGPALVDVAAFAATAVVAGEGEWASRNRRGVGPTIHGIRAYRDSDNPRRIHWKASAKRSALGGAESWLVREMEAEEDAVLALMWPGAAATAGWAEAEGEAFVGYAASLIVWLNTREIRASIFVPAEGGALRVRGGTGEDGGVAAAFLALVDPNCPVSEETSACFAPASLPPGRPFDLLEGFFGWRGRRV